MSPNPGPLMGGSCCSAPRRTSSRRSGCSRSGIAVFTAFGDVKDSSLPADAAFSPDGRWVAYQRGTPGEVEGVTYVEPSSDWREVSGRFRWAAAMVPRWPGALHRSLARSIYRHPRPRVSPSNLGSPVSLPRGFGAASPFTERTFDVMPDGRFLGVGSAGQANPTTGLMDIRIVINWFEELKTKAGPH